MLMVSFVLFRLFFRVLVLSEVDWGCGGDFGLFVLGGFFIFNEFIFVNLFSVGCS